MTSNCTLPNVQKLNCYIVWELRSFVCQDVPFLTFHCPQSPSLPSHSASHLYTRDNPTRKQIKQYMTWKKKRKEMHACHVESLTQIFQHACPGWHVLSRCDTNRWKHPHILRQKLSFLSSLQSASPGKLILCHFLVNKAGAPCGVSLSHLLITNL